VGTKRKPRKGREKRKREKVVEGKTRLSFHTERKTRTYVHHRSSPSAKIYSRSVEKPALERSSSNPPSPSLAPPASHFTFSLLRATTEGEKEYKVHCREKVVKVESKTAAISSKEVEGKSTREKPSSGRPEQGGKQQQ
jgi:hypothetical protein